MEHFRALTVVIAALGVSVLRASEICLAGDFETQFDYIVKKELLLGDEISERFQVCLDLQTLLDTRWPGTKMLSFGSLTTGLGLKTSDADCVAAVPGYETTQWDRYLTVEATKMFLQQPDIYRDLQVDLADRVPVITFFYAPTQTYCDLSFRRFTGVQNSKLIRYFMFLDERVRHITAFLKFWSQVHGISGENMLPSYGMAVLAVFYFQQKKIVPPIRLLQKDVEAVFVDNWNNAFDEIPYHTMNTENIYELLRGFFEYYNDFNFDEYIVSAFAGRPILKRLFDDVDTVPDDFVLYKHWVKKGVCKPAKIYEPSVWIQDSFEHDHSIIEKRKPTLPETLLFHIKYAAKMFNELPSREVLRAILVPNTMSVYNHAKLVLDKISEDKNCENEVY